MSREEFHKQALSVINDGAKARAGIAQAQANKFLSQSVDFDPRVLQKLGSSGLRHFLSTIDHSNLLAESDIEKSSEKPIETSSQNGESFGWSKQRRSEPLWIIRALIYGLSTGFILLALSTTTLKIINLGIY